MISQRRIPLLFHYLAVLKHAGINRFKHKHFQITALDQRQWNDWMVFKFKSSFNLFLFSFVSSQEKLKYALFLALSPSPHQSNGICTMAASTNLHLYFSIQILRPLKVKNNWMRSRERQKNSQLIFYNFWNEKNSFAFCCEGEIPQVFHSQWLNTFVNVPPSGTSW